MGEPILELKGIHVLAKDKLILKNINLSVEQGELIAILGESGSGKSTLLYSELFSYPKHQKRSIAKQKKV